MTNGFSSIETDLYFVNDITVFKVSGHINGNSEIILKLLTVQYGLLGTFWFSLFLQN